MPFIIGPSQGAFFKNKQILDKDLIGVEQDLNVWGCVLYGGAMCLVGEWVIRWGRERVIELRFGWMISCQSVICSCPSLGSLEWWSIGRLWERVLCRGHGFFYMGGSF